VELAQIDAETRVSREKGTGPFADRLRQKAAGVSGSTARGAVLGVLLALLPFSLFGCRPGEVEEKPNIVIILTDDQRVESLRGMTAVQEHLASQGTYFENSFATTPMCCPSRATLLTGLYAHNHGVERNANGASLFKRSGAEQDTIATRLQTAGYETGLSGKYLNGYESRRIPPGWDGWWVYSGKGDSYPEWTANDNGKLKTFRGEHVHETDWFAARAESFVRAEHQKPWFLLFAPKNPHRPARPPERYRGVAVPQEFQVGPAFNELDVSDKPQEVREQDRLKPEEQEALEKLYERQQRSLMAVDQAVGELVAALTETDQLENTFIVLASDNGFMFGEHRLEGKVVPYEEAVRVPLVVRGPGVAVQTRSELVGNVDWAPTIAEWAGVSSEGMDGRSFSPLLSTGRSQWRGALLIEAWGDVASTYAAVRTADRMYVEYPNGEREYYDLGVDPHQLENSYPSADPALVTSMERKLDALRGCEEAGCWGAEAAKASK
jgi:N-acetylglucosamine-6-sulfatase